MVDSLAAAVAALPLRDRERIALHRLRDAAPFHAVVHDGPSPGLLPMRAKTTLLALTCAAAFGGFAATALRDVVQQPAGAVPIVPGFRIKRRQMQAEIIAVQA